MARRKPKSHTTKAALRSTPVTILVDDVDENGKAVKVARKDTSVGRVLFNQYVPKEIGYVNEIISKKSLRTIIGKVIKKCGVTRSAQFLDDIKNLGYRMAFRGGLSFNLGDVIIPKEKEEYVAEGHAQVEEVLQNYQMGFITGNERYNQVIDIWTHINNKLASTLMKQMAEDRKGFNSVYTMLDSGARGSKDRSVSCQACVALWPSRRRPAQRAADHREPDSCKLQGGSFGAGILHLYARCA